MYLNDRLFSENTEEIFYSVLMDGTEYDLYRLFARVDYEGLSKLEKTLLKKKRSEYAKALLRDYRKTQKAINESKIPVPGSRVKIGSRVSGGGVDNSLFYEFTAGEGLTKKHLHDFNNASHRANTSAKKRLREQVEDTIYDSFPTDSTGIARKKINGFNITQEVRDTPVTHYRERSISEDLNPEKLKRSRIW